MMNPDSLDLLKYGLLQRGFQRNGKRWGGLPACLAMLSLFASMSVFGGVYTVINLNDNGAGSLRQAILDANANGGADDIDFAITGAISLSSDYPVISDDLTITGPGTGSLSIGGTGRVFTVTAGKTVAVSDLTITNAFAASPQFAAAIWNYGDLTLTRVTITANVLSCISCFGPIYNEPIGTLTVVDGIISDNEGWAGAGIASSGTLVISGSVISGNTTDYDGYGGGLMVDGGSLTLTDSTVTGNTSSAEGGGIYVASGASADITGSTISLNQSSGGSGNLSSGAGIWNGGTTTLTASTVSGNAAAYCGGGIYLSSGALTITNSTIAENAVATTGSCDGGGGIFAAGVLTVNNSTISGNTGRTPPWPQAISNGIYMQGAGLKQLKNTILANNAGNNCYGAVASLNHNLSDDTSCTFYLNQAGDLNGIDPGMDPGGLQDNGGQTRTLALVSGSAALDAIPPSDCTDANSIAVGTDQRGQTRPQNINCDIGAYELEVVNLTYTVTSSVGSGNGAITPLGAQTVNENDTPSFTLDPAPGWAIDTVGGSCGGSLNNQTFTTAAVATDCTVVANFVFDADSFVTTWKTDNAGTSDDTSITVPMIGGPYGVDWDNDGVFDETGLVGPVTHNFGSAGTYTIRIKGGYTSIKFINSGDKLKLLSIDQWGTGSWLTMESAFWGATNLQVLATDTPDFSQLTSMGFMFANAASADPDTSTWDTSSVTNMSNVFFGAASAIPDTSAWDTSKVTVMSGMFYGATSADPDVSGWDTSAVTHMGAMFFSASSAKPETSLWNTSKVKNMSAMFRGAILADPDVSGWDTSEVTDMSYMFFGAIAANPDTSGIGWSTAKVTTMSRMFYNASLADPDTSTWDTALVTDMEDLFYAAHSANPDVGAWDTGAVKNMAGMFNNATTATPDTSGWDTAAVTNMKNMFYRAAVADPNTGGWDTANVTNMSGMFWDAPAANPATSNWVTSSVMDMSIMFRGAIAANPDVGNWDTSSVTTTAGMFQGASSFDRDIGSWNVTALSNASNMFQGISLSVANYDSLLKGWNSQVLQPAVTFDGGNSIYCTQAAIDARANMIAVDGWVITDGGECPPDTLFSDGFEVLPEP